ncbi:MAG: nuclear transport factor 2 family protein [candidate division NC10 bacterium]
MAIVRDFETAFNRQDVDALVALFAPTASYTDTFYGTHRGHGDLRAMFQKMFREGCQYAWTFDPVVESPACAMAEGMSLFELSGGKIAAYREHFDEGQALLQLGFAPESLAKVLRRKLEAR